MKMHKLCSEPPSNDAPFTRQILFQEGGNLVFALHIRPGQSLPPHRHPGASVILLVLGGEGIILMDGNPAALSPGDVVEVDGKEEISLENTGEAPLSVYINLFKTSGS